MLGTFRQNANQAIAPVVVSAYQRDVTVSTIYWTAAQPTASAQHGWRTSSVLMVIKVCCRLRRWTRPTEMRSLSLKVTGASVTLAVIYVRPHIHVNGLRTADLTQWPHLSGVTLLIGEDVPEALTGP